jgi:hypothetical protein
MTLINRFERSCGTFRKRGGKNLVSLTTLGQFDQKKKKKTKKKQTLKNKFLKNNNDHGVDVSIIMII